MPWRLVLATNNPHKVRELREIAELYAPGQLELLLPEELSQPWEGIEEVGATLEENAYLKATALFERLWVPVVADDTGLEIEALGGLPGVRSARFVGQRCGKSPSRAGAAAGFPARAAASTLPHGAVLP